MELADVSFVNEAEISLPGMCRCEAPEGSMMVGDVIKLGKWRVTSCTVDDRAYATVTRQGDDAVRLWFEEERR